MCPLSNPGKCENTVKKHLQEPLRSERAHVLRFLSNAIVYSRCESKPLQHRSEMISVNVAGSLEVVGETNLYPFVACCSMCTVYSQQLYWQTLGPLRTMMRTRWMIFQQDTPKLALKFANCVREYTEVGVQSILNRIGIVLLYWVAGSGRFPGDSHLHLKECPRSATSWSGEDYEGGRFFVQPGKQDVGRQHCQESHIKGFWSSLCGLVSSSSID